jgi:hypothetical protein
MVRVMTVWRVTGNEIGPHGNGAMFFATKAEADEHRREYLTSDFDGKSSTVDPPKKIAVRNRAELAAALNDAMGYGAS